MSNPKPACRAGPHRNGKGPLIIETAPLHRPEFYGPESLPLFGRLRREDPVYCHEYDHGRLWVLTRHADVVTFARDHERFSACVPMIRTPETDPINQMVQGSIVASDPPEHTRIRGLVRDYFTARAVAGIDQRTRDYIASVLDKVERGEPCNFVPLLAQPLPIFVIGEILGVPEDERAELTDVTEAVLTYADPSAGLTEVGFEALTRCMGFLHNLVQRNRSEPKPGPLTDLQALDDLEAVKTLYVLLLGGFETTKSLMTYGLVALLDHPNQLTRMQREPALIPPAIEELLRWTTPITYFCRLTTDEVELSGKTIPAGEQLVGAVLSANRDEAVFGPTGSEFRIDRDPNRHVSFGFGAHFCIGAHLARSQTLVFFQELFRRFTSVERAGPVREKLMNSQTHSMAELPLRLS